MEATKLTTGMRLKLRDGREMTFVKYSQYFKTTVVCLYNDIEVDIHIKDISYYLSPSIKSVEVCKD